MYPYQNNNNKQNKTQFAKLKINLAFKRLKHNDHLSLHMPEKPEQYIDSTENIKKREG
jgi:hypothetical protein